MISIFCIIFWLIFTVVFFNTPPMFIGMFAVIMFTFMLIVEWKERQ